MNEVISGREAFSRAERYLRHVAKTGEVPGWLGPYGITSLSYAPARYEPRWSRSAMQMVWIPIEIYLDAAGKTSRIDGTRDTERHELHLRRLSDALDIPWTIPLWPAKVFDPDEKPYDSDWPGHYLALYGYGGMNISRWTLRGHILGRLAEEVQAQSKGLTQWQSRSASTR